MRTSTVRWYLVAAIAMLSLPYVGTAYAKTFQCGSGDVGCLIAAINEANAIGHNNTIRLESGTYTLTNVDNVTNGAANGLPSITSTLSIEVVSNNTAIIARTSFAPNFRLMHVGPNGHLTLQGVTLRNGRIVDGGGLFNNGGVVTITNSTFSGNLAGNGGGGLLNNGGVVTITNSTFSGNFSGGPGAGLLNNGGVVDIVQTDIDSNTSVGPAGLVTVNGIVRITRSRFIQNSGGHDVGGLDVRGGTALISNTTFAGNFADGSGAILVENGATVAIMDSAFAGNRAAGSGAGAGILNLAGTVEITNTTFARNVLAPFFNGQNGIAIFNRGRLTLTNSTLAENTVFKGVPDSRFRSVVFSDVGATTILQNTILSHSNDDEFIQDCGGDITSLGNNLISDSAACGIILQPTDLTGDPGLGAFTDNGSARNGHFPLLETSQAINSGNDRVCPRKDQIGNARTGQCDIGSIEFRKNELGRDEIQDGIKLITSQLSR